jgi:prepilin peptidase dependent protein B
MCSRNSFRLSIKFQTGLSLIELMIGLLVGTIVVAGGVSIFTGSARNTTENVKVSQLNQDLRIMMDVMVQEIRRAGHISVDLISGEPGLIISNESGFLNAMRANPFDEINIEQSGACITFLYDKTSTSTSPGTVDNADRMGFKLVSDALQMRRFSTALACATSNASTRWESITSPEVVITDLAFTLESILLNLTLKKAYPNAAVVSCNNPSPHEHDQCIPVSGVATNLSNFNTLGDECLAIRKVTIKLNGNLKDDPAIKQTIDETVKVRNDKYGVISSLAPLTCS